MQGQSNDNVDKLSKFLADQGLEVEEISNGMRIRLNSGNIVEVNALVRDSDFFWASFETTKAPREKIRETLTDIKRDLSNQLMGLATLGEFEETQNADNRLVFVANIEMVPSIEYHGVVGLEDVSAEIQVGQIHKPRVSEPGKKDKISGSSEDLAAVAEIQVGQINKPPASEPDKKDKISGSSEDLAAAAEAIKSLESVDGKMLRQSLDMMNLRRSSNIRLAMTRIFRSASDSKEFLSAIKEEAEKISSPEDMEELEIIRMISATGFLQPVVDLLYKEVHQQQHS